jgi:S1-C subfamily serine protease
VKKPTARGDLLNRPLLRAAAVVAAVAVGAIRAPARGEEPEEAAPAGPYCSGEYADDLAALPARAREFEQAQPHYTYCIRTTAVYECPYYASDGTLKRTRTKVVAHGTGFGLRRDGNDTLVVTNEHVSDWPAVTDAEHPVEGVAAGCKRLSDTLRIVDDESDAYERDDVTLGRVVADPQLDVSVLRARAALPVVPWRVGRSAALRERNAVTVRGFPLGVLRTTTAGKVTSAYEHDDERDWDHEDFVVDALLSPGNSGSPVFAVSCRTGEFELVGVYHAAYLPGSALNVVVSVDQLRPLFDTLRRGAPRPREPAVSALDTLARERLAGPLRAGAEPFFPFGPLTAAVRARGDGALLFQVMGKEFPVRTQPVLVIEDLPAAGDFGRPGRLWAGNGRGLRAVDRAAVDADGQAQLARILDALRRDALLSRALDEHATAGVPTRERFDEVARLERGVARLATVRGDLAQAALDVVERVAPGDGDGTVTLADILAPPLPAAPVAEERFPEDAPPAEGGLGAAPVAAVAGAEAAVAVPTAVATPAAAAPAPPAPAPR